MKKQILNSLTTAFFLSLVIFMSCGGDDEPQEDSAAKQQFERIAKTWNVASATADNQMVDGWTDLTITFGGTETSGTYNTNNMQPDGTTLVWPSSGQWTFASEENVTTITRSDDVEIGLAVNTEGTTATLTFDITDTGGRTDIVEGNWRFELTAQ